MTRLSLLPTVIALGLLLALPTPAAAQSPTCDSLGSGSDRLSCNKVEDRYRQPSVQAPPQAEPPAELPADCNSLSPDDRTMCLRYRGVVQGLLGQSKVHDDAPMMSAPVQRALLECLRGRANARRLACYDRAMGMWRQEMVDAGLIPQRGDAP